MSSEENIYDRTCCRLNDMKHSIVDFLTYCHVKPQSAKVCQNICCLFVQAYILQVKWRNGVYSDASNLQFVGKCRRFDSELYLREILSCIYVRVAWIQAESSCIL